MSLRKKLKGTGVAMVTPFNANGSIDFSALEKLINFLIDSKVEYLVSLGTTGETPVLSKEEKLDIVNFTYEKVNNRVPVVVGIGGNNTHEIVADLHKFPLDKAAAVLSASPYYSKPSQEGIIEHYKVLAKESPKPIILYNVPGRTGRNMTAATTLTLSQISNIEGMKEASGDMAQCMQILRDKPDEFLLVSGDDGVALPQLACGMDGVISVAANAYPAEFSNMVRACLQGNFNEAKKLNDPLIDAYDYMFAENNPAGVKAFLAIKGICENNFRLPVVPVSNELMEKIKKYMQA